MIGTPYYLAPEQIMDSKSAGSASDQYALGIILYECLTGRRPYDGENLFVVFQGIVGGTPRRPRELRPEIPAEMEEVVLRAMKSDPKLRFATIEDFGRALLPFASGRARVIWDEAFAGGTGDGGAPPGRPSIAVAPTPAPPTKAATLMPPGLANPSNIGPIPGAMTPTPGPQKTIAWGQSPMPQPRMPTGATMPGSPESVAAASVRASVAMSKQHPVVPEGGPDDSLDMAPAPARSKKGILIAGVAAVAVAGIAVFALTGKSGGTKAEAPAVAQPAEAAKPVEAAKPAEAAKSVEAAKPIEAAKPVAPPPVEPAAVKPDAPPAEVAGASPEHQKGEGKGKGKSKPHEHGQGHGREAHGGGAAKPAGKPAAGGVPVID
jgi:serine/threonine-protein kinase